MDQPEPNGMGVSAQNMEQDPVATLTKIRDLFVNGPLEEAMGIISSAPETFINNLIDVHKEDVILVQQLLQLFRDKMPEAFNQCLISHLQSSSLPVRKFAIEQIYSLLKDNPTRLTPESHSQAYSIIADLLGDKDASVFNKAILILSDVDVEKYPFLLDKLQAPLKGDTSSKCNVFDVIVNISTKSEAYLLKCAQYIDNMMDELVTTRDILYQLNLLEFLTRLVVTQPGFTYFSDRQIFETISDLMHNADERPMRSLILPGYLKFFGAVANLHASGAFSFYPSIVELLLEILMTDDRSMLIVALDTLAYVGCTVEAKLRLTEIGSKFQSVVSKVSEYINNSPTDIKVRALACMDGLVSVERDKALPQTGQVDVRITLMTREWFRSLNPEGNAMGSLYEICKNPFPDIRLAAFGLLDSACQHNWGAEMVAATPGFVEFLLDRSVEHSKDTKEAKYAIVRRLSRMTSFDPAVVIKMTTFLDQGVFFKETGLEVAMEGDN